MSMSDATLDLVNQRYRSQNFDDTPQNTDMSESKLHELNRQYLSQNFGDMDFQVNLHFRVIIICRKLFLSMYLKRSKVPPVNSGQFDFCLKKKR